MKLAGLVVLLMFGGVAYADDPQPVDPYGPVGAPPPRAQRPQRGQLHQMLLQRFDRNRDGQLEPRERRHAARVLRRLARRLMMQDMRQQMQMNRQPMQRPQMQRQGFFRRYDLNRDGDIGPGELPPAVADELRPLDRDGDGWLRGDELP